MKKTWPQPGDLGFSKLNDPDDGVGVAGLVALAGHLGVSSRQPDGIPYMPVRLVQLPVRTPVIYVGVSGRDIWFTPQGLYVQLIPDAQVTKD